MNTSTSKIGFIKRIRFGALGALLGAAVLMPTTALGWNYSNVPLFWVQGIKPNVALMMDNSGSMNAITTNESFQRAKITGTLSTTEWYWCNGDYNSATNKCASKNSSALRGFTVEDWNPTSTSTMAIPTISRRWFNGYASPSSCTSGGGSGFYRTTAGAPVSPNTTAYLAQGICLPGHGLPNGTRIDLNFASTSGSASPAGPLYVMNATANGFQVSSMLGGAPVNINVKLGTSGSFGYNGYQTTLPTYIDQTAALCDVTKTPGAPRFYTGVSGNSVWLNSNTVASATNIPTRDTVGVLISNTSSSGTGTRDSCVRWKMATTKRYQGNPTNGYDYTRWDNGTLYYTPDTGTVSTDEANSVTSLYPRHLLNTLLPSSGNASVNFDDNTTYPDNDSDPASWNPATDIYVIPNATRMEAAREAGQKVVLDFYGKLNIGLFTLKNNTTQAPVYAIPNGAAPLTAKTDLISTTEGLLPADLPLSVLDGKIGKFADTQSSGTPLSATQAAINNYYKGGSSPIQYRCQKNYAVVMTDGDPTSDESGNTMDNRAQEGYDTDAKTSGNDADGKSWDDPTDSNKWKIQNVITYTVGLGLENNLLKRAPLVNKINVAKSNVNIGGNNTIKLDKHGLTTGDYVHVVSNAAGGLTSGNYYYAVVVDANNFKLASVRTSSSSFGDDSSSPGTNTRKAVDNCVAGTNATTNGALGCMMVTNNGGSSMVLSTGPGKAFFSFTPDQLASDMGKVFNSINNLTSSASAVSTNTKQFGGGGGGKELVYQARFNTEDWSGEVAAYEVSIVGGKATVDTSDTATPFWTTKDTLTNASKRLPSKMFTWNPATPAGVSFAWGSLSAAQQTALGGATNGPNVVSWLQGNNVSGLRSHSAKYGLLGDILGADPVFFNYARNRYSKLPASAGSCTIAGDNKSASGTGCTGAEIYSQYVADGKANRTPMIYVGSNDGMLHAFEAMTGNEKMTFIPNAVYTDGTEKKFVNLTDPNYDHRYFVDGSASVSDAFDGSVWQSYLLFGLGRGGKSVSAINVTDTTYTASDIQWEFSNAELGYTYGTPVVARFADNKWYAIFPNGLDSTSQQASVFVVNINNAADYHLLTTGVGSVGTPNGMMAIQPKLSADRTVTDIYAGDIRGNVWKFDVYNEGTSSVQWNNGVKLFTTGNASTGTPQSITGGLRVGKHPSGLGSIIYFGTGKYFEVGDNSYSGSSVPQVDTFYAVLDDGSTTNLTRGQLKPQTFTMVGNNRTASQNSVSYSGSEMGWYIDLLDGATKRGERVNSTPLLSGGRVIFASIIPSSGASCGGEGSSYLNELDALTGGMLNDKVLDTNNDGKIDSSDTQVASVQLNGLISDPSIVGGQDRDYKIIGSTSSGGSVQILSETKTGSGDDNGIPKGRVSWQQLQ